MGWISTKLLGVRRILMEGVFAPERPALNFIGLGVADNPEENRTDVTCTASNEVDAATHLAVAGRLVRRAIDGGASFGGVSVFEALQVEGAGGITTTALDCTEPALFEQGLTADDAVKATAHTLAGAAVEERVQEGSPMAVSTDWAVDGDGRMINLIVGRKVTVPLDVPHGAELNTVTVGYRAATGHAAFPGGAPATMPYVDVRFYDTTGGEDSILDQLDTSSSAAAFESDHTITVTGMTHTVDRTSRRYHVEITSEVGSGSIVGARLLYVVATWTRLDGSIVGQD